MLKILTLLLILILNNNKTKFKSNLPNKRNACVAGTQYTTLI